MKQTEKILFFFVLPIIALLLYPPETLFGGVGVLAVALVFFVALGAFQLRGFNLALTFAIFLQGFNVIIRVMMFWNNGFGRSGTPNLPFIIATVMGIILSIWLLLRLDRQDIRVQMTR